MGIVTDGRRVALGFADGSTIFADVVIGAGGVHSLPRASISASPTARASPPASPSRSKWWVADRHMAVYSVTAARDEVYFATGIGAAMALEEAVVLARCFAKMAGASLEQVFDAYEATRKPPHFAGVGPLECQYVDAQPHQPRLALRLGMPPAAPLAAAVAA